MSTLGKKDVKKRAAKNGHNKQSPLVQLRKVDALETQLQQLMFQTRQLGNQLSKAHEARQEDVKFNLSIMLSVNGMANALMDSGILSAEQLDAGREKAIKTFQEENKRREDNKSKTEELAKEIATKQAEAGENNLDRAALTTAVSEAFEDRDKEEVDQLNHIALIVATREFAVAKEKKNAAKEGADNPPQV